MNREQELMKLHDHQLLVKILLELEKLNKKKSKPESKKENDTDINQ
jgi:hypothetical protein